MQCPFCHHADLKVVDSRNALEANAIRRRRQCLKCHKRFTTFEMVELSLQVKKRNDHYEDFDEQKIIRGLEAACRHTKISREQIKDLTSKITIEIMQKQAKEITAKEIGEMVMDHLQKLDNVAYIRFACVYRRFKSIDELMSAIANLHPLENMKK